MRPTSKNMHSLRLVPILKGTMIASVCSVAICGAVAYLIPKGNIPAKMGTWISISILLISSYLGGKYSNKASGEKRIHSALLTGIIFILLLMIINISIPGSIMNDTTPKIISALTGSALASLGSGQKGRGRTIRKH